ncbi:hypothetical protein B0H16DRAFT_1893910 [Mycena metata]|uniref:Uncharacterized protein n=1 Tax=Mycena metata TaxID=1033252 RepID=A0AAD7HVL0_9AGAR|nr:hypothetical protein B0H16DRAFT_1893910 [Mycena metata]
MTGCPEPYEPDVFLRVLPLTVPALFLGIRMIVVFATVLQRGTTRRNGFKNCKSLDSYDWHRAGILAALINGAFLVALCFSITLEALERFFAALEKRNPASSSVGSFGLASNLLGLFESMVHRIPALVCSFRVWVQRTNEGSCFSVPRLHPQSPRGGPGWGKSSHLSGRIHVPTPSHLPTSLVRLSSPTFLPSTSWTPRAFRPVYSGRRDVMRAGNGPKTSLRETMAPDYALPQLVSLRMQSLPPTFKVSGYAAGVTCNKATLITTGTPPPTTRTSTHPKPQPSPRRPPRGPRARARTCRRRGGARTRRRHTPAPWAWGSRHLVITRAAVARGSCACCIIYTFRLVLTMTDF